VYSFPDHELPDTRVDQLAFGLVTTQRVAVLVRVVSGSSSDFIEMELVRIYIYIYVCVCVCVYDVRRIIIDFVSMCRFCSTVVKIERIMVRV